MISQSTDDLVKRIDEAVARFPIRNKGVYWLHASEWDVLKDTIERLQRELAAQAKTIETLREDAERYRWLRYRTGSLEVVGLIEKRGVRLDEAIDAARSEGGSHE